MAKISIAIRQQVFEKYGGKCAYCGCDLQKGWNVDHIEPAWHTWTEEEAARHKINKGVECITNYNPSCPRCNKWKSTFTIEEFREEIQFQIGRLNRYSSNYRLAKDYGLVLENEPKVKFYFEIIKPNKDE